MFDIDKWQEILATISKNKLRTFLTAMSVAWGLYMLVFMLGAGSGLEHGILRGFGDYATNSGEVWGRRTSMPYAGLQAGRYVSFTYRDMEIIRNKVKGIDLLAPHSNRSFLVSRSNKSESLQIRGDVPDLQKIDPKNVSKGRFLNELDIKEKRKVVVIGRRAKQLLFDEEEEAIGDFVKIKGVFFKVVGIFQSKRNDEWALEQEKNLYIPLPTMQQALTNNERIDYFTFTALPDVAVSDVEKAVKEELRKIHKVSPEDKNAIGSWNMEEEFAKIQGMFLGINGLIWIVGVFTILAGVIGVSNIMLIVVKERTKEIGLRKALGATPFSIISLIIQESVFITAMSGYVGLFFGIMVVDGIRYLVDEVAGGVSMFASPSIDGSVALSALAFLVVSGMFAGILPAIKAAAVSPVEALRDE
ncbi:ABC transporter permease [Limibacter armeniacum]|uniref:ABC transporter permease n=1 Tax=Limibacter armeniacum TaxID=466084 RepID=UPI002FE60F8F